MTMRSMFIPDETGEGYINRFKKYVDDNMALPKDYVIPSYVNDSSFNVSVLSDLEKRDKVEYPRPWLDKAKDEYYWGKKINQEDIQSADFGLKVDIPKFVRSGIDIHEDIDKYLQSYRDYIDRCRDFHKEATRVNNQTGVKLYRAKMMSPDELRIDWGVDMPKYSNVDSCTGRVYSVKINVSHLDETYENEEKQMTSKFKAGDKVVRTEPYVWTFDEGFMQEGKEYIVESITDGGNLIFKGNYNSYVPSKFKLVPPVFKNMKFRVNSPEHSKDILEALFEMGFCRRSHGCEVRFTDSFPPCDYLYTDTDGYIWRIVSEGDYLVSSFKSAQEFVVETTKSYKIIPVVAPKPEIITIGGKTYDKETVLKRLAELEEVA